MFDIVVRVEGEFNVDVASLRQTAVVVLARYDVTADTGLAIVMTSNEHVAQLNRQFRGIDAATDVLSFPADHLPPGIVGESPYLGDLVIAYPYAARQAEQLGHDVSDMLSLLIVHGTLHLLGFSHDDPADYARMWAAQDMALDTLGISLAIAPRLESMTDEH